MPPLLEKNLTFLPPPLCTPLSLLRSAPAPSQVEKNSLEKVEELIIDDILYHEELIRSRIKEDYKQCLVY